MRARITFSIFFLLSFWFGGASAIPKNTRAAEPISLTASIGHAGAASGHEQMLPEENPGTSLAAFSQEKLPLQGLSAITIYKGTSLIPRVISRTSLRPDLIYIKDHYYLLLFPFHVFW